MNQFPFEVQPLLDRALAAARLAGLELSNRFGKAVETKMKGIDDPVTEADMAAARVLGQELLQSPVSEWLCEESRDVPKSPIFWAVDPMDGTKSFLNNEPDFTVSIGLIAHKIAILGVIYNPITKEMYYAIRGQGLQTENVKARPMAKVPMNASTMVLSRTELKRGQLEPIPGAVASIIPIGSIANKMAQVAAGLVHATISRTHKSLWDFAAGTLLIEEAGGRATDFWNDPLDGRATERQGVIAAAPDLHEEIRIWLHTHRLDRPV